MSDDAPTCLVCRGANGPLQGSQSLAPVAAQRCSAPVAAMGALCRVILQAGAVGCRGRPQDMGLEAISGTREPGCARAATIISGDNWFFGRWR